MDFINKEIKSLSKLSIIIIDDNKQVIERAFIEIINNILNNANDKCQKVILWDIIDNDDEIFKL